jgi:hypothetical protein
MSPVMLVAAALAVVLLYLVARRHAHVPAAVTGDTEVLSLDWLAPHGSRPLSRDEAHPVVTGWHTLTISGLSAAEELLDRLEANGVAEAELFVLGESTFAVRWR